MKELIERLEKATGPDRESDYLIFEATAFPTEYFGSKVESWSRGGAAGYTVNTADGMRHLSAFNAPHYTASLDAALSLVPEGWQWLVTNRAPAPHTGRAYLNNRELHFAGIGGMRPNPEFRARERTAATPAIATCIAALLSRITQLEQAPTPLSTGK